MKRYDIVVYEDDDGFVDYWLDESVDGEVVKYEDVKKLEELNRELVEIIRAECADCKVEELNQEMYETLKSIHFYLQQIGSVDSLLRNSLYQEQEAAVRKMLVKAEGREVQGE